MAFTFQLMLLEQIIHQLELSGEKVPSVKRGLGVRRTVFLALSNVAFPALPLHRCILDSKSRGSYCHGLVLSLSQSKEGAKMERENCLSIAKTGD